MRIYRQSPARIRSEAVEDVEFKTRICNEKN